MKLSIRQDVLLNALEKGASAALTESAQTDTGNLSLFLKSIKINVTDKFTIESTTNMMAVMYSVDATKENGIVVGEKGSVIVPAKEFIDWVKIQGSEAIVTMKLSKLDVPEIINSAEGDDNQAFVIKKIGSLKFISKDTNKTGVRWELDCYDTEGMSSINFSDKGDQYFECKASSFKEAVKFISFASLSIDAEHVLDSMSIQNHNDKVYIVATDTNRCAVYNLKEAVNIQNKEPLLIQFSLLTKALDICTQDIPISFNYNSTNHKLFMSQQGLDIRLTLSEKDKVLKFPSITKLLLLKYDKLAELDAKLFLKTLQSASLVNKTSALFEFNKDPEHNFIVTTISETNKYKPSVSKSFINEPSLVVKVVWGVRHIIDVLKIMKSETVELYLPENKRNVKIVGKNNENFMYFTQVINNPKYSAS